MLTRRRILAMLGAIGAIGTMPAIGWAAAPGPVQERLPWVKFRKSGDYARLVRAVRTMKANANPASPDSWQFWANIHQNHCPHGKDYFLAWHRGYLWLFEAQLRAVAQSSSLRLPYWDYFADPKLPAELLAGNAATNPLYEARKGSEVGRALGYAAFSPDVLGFQRGVKNCFETNVEAFHNNVHNLIGGRMATMQSPQDIVFWLHHANIDRLWAAWAAAGRGRQMPPPGEAYWGGQFDYAPDLGIKRAEAMRIEALGYVYADLKMPVLDRDVGGSGGGPGGPMPRGGAALPQQPPVVAMAAPPAAAAPAAPIPFRGIWLGSETRSVRMPLRRAEGGLAAGMDAMEDHAVRDIGDELSVVLDAITLTQIGVSGGYFYKLYLDLDDLDYGQVPGEDRLIGTVGPFQIAAALSHAEGGRARIVIPAGEAVRRLVRARASEDLGVTFVRVDAAAAPAGSVISIERVEFRGQLG